MSGYAESPAFHLDDLRAESFRKLRIRCLVAGILDPTLAYEIVEYLLLPREYLHEAFVDGIPRQKSMNDHPLGLANRCARAMACCSVLGLSWGSMMTTAETAWRFTPWPPAMIWEARIW